MMKLKIRYSEYGLDFEWFGGEYIDVKFIGAKYPIDCINTWDHKLDKSIIEFTKGNLRKEADEWLVENKENLADFRMIST